MLQYRNGLVLSGGGARGMAHAGVLQALEENSITPHVIAGTSAGALVAALYANGTKPREILRIIKESKFFGWKNIAWERTGFFSMDPMRKLLSSILPSTFEELKLPIFVTNTNLVTGESAIIAQGPLIDPLLASACVPMVFKPVIFKGAIWVDGGVVNNFPIEPLLGQCDRIIGSHVNKLSAESEPDKWSMLRIADQSFHVAIAHDVRSKSNLCNIFFEPELFHIRLFDTDKADEIYSSGYETAMMILANKTTK